MIEREFIATIDELNNVSSFIEEELEKLFCPMKTVMQIQLAAEEIFVNIAQYAYKGSSGKMKLAIFSDSSNSVSLRFSDHGTKFDPLQKQDPDISLNVNDREIGGLGIFMVKKTMDKVEYTYESDQNILTITKNFQ